MRTPDYPYIWSGEPEGHVDIRKYRSGELEDRDIMMSRRKNCGCGRIAKLGIIFSAKKSTTIRSRTFI